MLIWHEVVSSSIRAIGCDPEKYEAWVEYLTRPGPYVYFGVPPEVYDRVDRVAGRPKGRKPHRGAVILRGPEPERDGCSPTQW